MMKKLFRFVIVALVVLGISFSNLPFYVVSEMIDSYIDARNIVDVAWNAQKDDQVVDKFVSLRTLPEKLKIHEARAATTFINVAHYNSASSSSAAINKPTNTADGDIMFAVIMRNAVIDPSTVPAGWTLAGKNLSTYGRWLYWKVASGEGTSYTWGWAAAAKTAITIATYRGGFNTASPIDVVSNTAYTTSNATVRAATMNVTAANSVLLNFATFYSTTVRTFTKPSVPTTGWAENYDGGATTSDFSRTIDSMTWTGSGATGNIDTTCSTTGTTVKHAFAVALKLPGANSPPTLSISQPPSGNTAVAEGSSFNVTYTLADTDNVVTAAFYYDTNNDGVGGTAMVGACAMAAEGTNATCSFNTTVLTPGTPYYVYGVTNDGVNPAVTIVSSGTITVNDAPTITVLQPDGTGDTVTVGSSYNITYNLADTDSVVTVDFYYDSDAAGLNGTAITSCQNQIEGSGVTCSWDTTGMTPGSYYVYGRGVSDGVNAETSYYSPGQITINLAGSLSVDIVDSGGAPVGSPSVTFGAKVFDWVAQQSTGTLGVLAQKIRVSNTTGTSAWTVSVAATSGPTALWTDGSNTYDFNGSSSTGRLRVDASGSTITPQGGCSATGLSKGAATYFAQGTQDSITLISANGSAQTNCYWDVTGVGMTQDIPATQIPSTYTLNLTLTVT